MKKLDRKIQSMILCIAELLIGVLLLIRPVGFTSGILVCTGVGIMVKGVTDIIAYFRTPAQEATLQKGLSRGLVCLLVGAFCAFRYSWLMSAVPFLGVVYAVLLLLLGVDKLQSAVDERRTGNEKWFCPAIAAAIATVCSIIIFLNPFTQTNYLWIFTGIALIVEAVIDIVSFALNQKKA